MRVIFFSISHSLLYHVYLPYDLFLNESVFVTVSSFLLLSMVNLLTISRARWKIAACIDTEHLQNTTKYDRQSNWMNIATIFMNAAMDKRVLQ